MNIFVNNQLVFFPNVQRMIDAFIIQSGDLLDSVIINNKINISEMPAVQLLALLIEHDKVLSNLKKIKKDIVQVAIRELGYAHGRCQVPPLDNSTQRQYQ